MYSSFNLSVLLINDCIKKRSIGCRKTLQRILQDDTLNLWCTEAGCQFSACYITGSPLNSRGVKLHFSKWGVKTPPSFHPCQLCSTFCCCMQHFYMHISSVFVLLGYQNMLCSLWMVAVMNSDDRGYVLYLFFGYCARNVWVWVRWGFVELGGFERK